MAQKQWNPATQTWDVWLISEIMIRLDSVQRGLHVMGVCSHSKPNAVSKQPTLPDQRLTLATVIILLWICSRTSRCDYQHTVAHNLAKIEHTSYLKAMQGVLSELHIHQLHPVFENALNILGVECIILSVKNTKADLFQGNFFMFFTLWWTFWFAYFANGRNVSVGYSIKCFNLTICFSSRLWLSGLWQALLCFSYKMHVYKRTLRFKWCVNASIIGLFDFLFPLQNK